VTACLTACEPPYYELLPTNIVCCVVIIFKVTILLNHMCMLPTFENPQIFKLVFVVRVMCTLSNDTIWIFWFDYSLECLPTSWVEDYVSIPTTDVQKREMHGTLLTKGLVSLCTSHVGQQAFILFQ